MTKKEQEQEKERARETAVEIGGLVALLLGVSAGKHTVSWDPRSLRFIVDGRYISLETVRRAILQIETRIGLRISRITDRFVAGEITLEDWLAETQKLVGSSHILMAALGLGSIAAAVASSAVQANITREKGFLTRFAQDIHKKGLSAAAIKARAKSYFHAARILFGNLSLDAHKITGYNEVRRVRTAAESCKGCIRWAGRWLPIGEMPPLGTLQCRNYCKCFFEFR